MEPTPIVVKKKHPASIVLNILLDGHPVQMEGDEWIYEDGVFGVVRDAFDLVTGKKDGSYILTPGISVSAFIKMCERLPEQDVIAAVFSHVVTKENRKKRP